MNGMEQLQRAQGRFIQSGINLPEATLPARGCIASPQPAGRVTHRVGGTEGTQVPAATCDRVSRRETQPKDWFNSVCRDRTG